MNPLADLDIVFIVGAPRSGTTWLRNMLGCHPRVAMPPESYVFHEYAGRLEAAWQRQRERPKPFGLPAVVDRQVFEEAIGAFIERVYRDVLERRPGADTILDKTPSHALCVDRLARFAPKGRIIHMLRDGRDVVASLLRAGHSWGSHWAPRDTTEAAKWWVRHVSAVVQAQARYTIHEVRYEDLRGSDGVRVLHEAFAFCGLDVTEEQARAAYRRFDLGEGGFEAMASPDLVRVTAKTVDDGFVGPATPGNWRKELTRAQQVTVERIAGDLLRELGYAEDGWSRGGHVLRALERAASPLWHRARYRGGHLRRAIQVRGFP